MSSFSIYSSRTLFVVLDFCTISFLLFKTTTSPFILASMRRQRSPPLEPMMLNLPRGVSLSLLLLLLIVSVVESAVAESSQNALDSFANKLLKSVSEFIASLVLKSMATASNLYLLSILVLLVLLLPSLKVVFFSRRDSFTIFNSSAFRSSVITVVGGGASFLSSPSIDLLAFFSKLYASAISIKFLTICFPYGSVHIDSGWNCTP